MYFPQFFGILKRFIAHIAELHNLVNRSAGFRLGFSDKFIYDNDRLRESVKKVGKSHEDPENEPLCDFVDFLEFFRVLLGLKGNIENIQRDNSVGVSHKLLDTVLISHILDANQSRVYGFFDLLVIKGLFSV